MYSDEPGTFPGCATVGVDQPLNRSCPDCQGPMEEGHVMGRTSGGGLALTPTTIGWLSGCVPPEGSGIGDMTASIPLADIGIFRWSNSARFPAWRCTRCDLVVFSYRDPQEAVHPEQRP